MNTEYIQTRERQKNLGTDKTVIVVGAGPAGMMAAGTAAKDGARVILLEKNSRPGRKLMITGKGRCNLTNNCPPEKFIGNIASNPRFLFSAVNSFTPRDTIAFFEELGLKLKTERGDRVFPLSDKACDVVEALSDYIKANSVRLEKAEVNGILSDGGCVRGVITADGRSLLADAVIIATGGLSYPLTGSTGDGYRFAESTGHNVIKPCPSLVPLTSDNTFCRDLQGLSLKNIVLKIIDKKNGNEIYRDFGEMLFTHFGLSGPVILSASAHMKGAESGRYKAVIDLKPALSEVQLDLRLQRDLQENLNKDISNSLFALLPRKLPPVILRLANIPFDTKCNSITKIQRGELLKTLKGLEVSVNGFRPVEEAIITSGGVDTKQINPKTMESKLVKGLYFSGEVIDVDAYTGGYNLQIAFSTGRVAGKSAAYTEE